MRAISLLFAGIILSNCRDDGFNPLINKNDTIVIVFNNAPKHIDTVELFKGVTFENTSLPVELIDSFHSSFYKPNSEIQTDTLRLVSAGEYMILRHSFNVISRFDYILKRGDTVIFRYENGVPYAKIPNRYSKKFDINFDFYYRKATLSSKVYSKYELYCNPFFSTIVSSDITGFVQAVNLKKAEYFLSAKADFISQLNFLDSLKKVDKISDIHYNFYKDRVRNLLSLIDIKESAIPSDSIDNIIKVAPADLPYSYYHDLLEVWSQVVIEKRMPTINLPNGSLSDYRKVFDTIASIPLRCPYKEILLYDYLVRIANNFARSDIEKYFKKFISFSNDSFLINDFRENYFLVYSNKNDSKDSLYLVDDRSKENTLEDILSKNHGSVVFLDFWASWCIPCRESMPESKRLAEKFKNKNIVFVYISIDRNLRAWKKASKDEDINSNNFLVIDPDVSAYLKKMKIEEIPRYVLYGKSGKMVFARAPGPGEELEYILDNLTKEKSN